MDSNKLIGNLIRVPGKHFVEGKGRVVQYRSQNYFEPWNRIIYLEGQASYGLLVTLSDGNLVTTFQPV